MLAGNDGAQVLRIQLLPIVQALDLVVVQQAGQIGTVGSQGMRAEPTHHRQVMQESLDIGAGIEAVAVKAAGVRCRGVGGHVSRWRTGAGPR